MPRKKKQAEPAATYRESYQHGIPVVHGQHQTTGKRTVAINQPVTSHGTCLRVETALADVQHPRVKQKVSKTKPEPMREMNHVINTSTNSADFGDVLQANDQDLSDRGLL